MQIGSTLYINDRDGLKVDLREAYGPYDSIDTANTAVLAFLAEIKVSAIPNGFTVAVKDDSGMQEYWWVDTEWVKKGGGAAALSIDVTTTTFATSTELNIQYPNSVKGSIVAGYREDDSKEAALYVKIQDGTSGLWIKTSAVLLDGTAQATTNIINAHVLSYK